ncbi:ExbD/TolR family protein [Roseibacillus ishigakijimensis]|uniref:Biopolymer transporter ExbD n=1 Tax=Roseibacillus ishigakijimensis TaxID=454146 RepID=A0A934RNX4_9BACT|nr:biopolymer transporter ExbD [Roseibacillus ishigakijimensis]MBK1832798.1 biopolymer transporter ExbD [Roseibacillus ishigakijimensis]
MKFKRPEPQPAGFQLAPMIDIVFLLLIFFIVTWQFSRSELDLKVSVPSSTDSKERENRTYLEIIINVRADGSTYVNGDPITAEALFDKLSAITRVERNQPVRVRGDANTPFQDIVRVMDICTRAGVWNVSFATQTSGGAS